MIIETPCATRCLTPKRPISNAELSAPRTSGAKLIEPPLGAADDLAAANRRRIDDSDYELQGRRLPVLAAQAREQLLAAALRYTRHLSRRRSAAGRRPSVSGRPSTRDVSSGRLVEELRLGAAGPAECRSGRQSGYRQRHDQILVAARARRLGRRAHARRGLDRSPLGRDSVSGPRDSGSRVVREFRGAGQRAAEFAGPRSAVARLLAESRGVFAANAESGRMLGPIAASMGRRLGDFDARDSPKRSLPFGGVSMADGPFAGPFAAVLGRV